ncbi:Vitamin B12 transporter BtuB [bioreactor metagenome]|uniref:Vitamin B12 transporter BtuB n=1 Tax=bioreactor metagenome TaxID=1076179 RepID=A0A645IBX7_9ZZZZ
MSIFKRNLNNAIDWKYISGEYHPYNIDNYRATGVNVSLTSKLTSTAASEVGYTYLDSHDQNNKGLGDPRHSFHLGINVHDGKLSQTINAIYQAESGSPGKYVDGRFIVNTNTNYSFTSDTSLFLTINNLFDKAYQSVYDFPANGRTVLLGIKQAL